MKTFFETISNFNGNCAQNFNTDKNPTLTSIKQNFDFVQDFFASKILCQNYIVLWKAKKYVQKCNFIVVEAS